MSRSAWALPLVFVALAVLAAGEHVAVPGLVAGRSMEPSLLAGDRVLVDRWTYRHRAPRAGEIVLVAAPDGRVVVKRVARLGTRDRGVWVVGDNPPESTDSRQFGPVPPDRVLGRVFLRYWPPSRAGRLAPPGR